MVHDLRVPADRAFRPAIAVRKQPAELVDGGFGIRADDLRVAADVRARVNATRPLREIVLLERRPHRDADFRFLRDAFQGDAALEPLASQVGSEGFARTHGGGKNRKNPSIPITA